MTNTNCLEGVKCPKCGHEDRFIINAHVTCVVMDNGSEVTGNHYWDETHSCCCGSCDYAATLKEFQIENQIADRELQS